MTIIHRVMGVLADTLRRVEIRHFPFKIEMVVAEHRYYASVQEVLEIRFKVIDTRNGLPSTITHTSPFDFDTLKELGSKPDFILNWIRTKLGLHPQLDSDQTRTSSHSRAR